MRLIIESRIPSSNNNITHTDQHEQRRLADGVNVLHPQKVGQIDREDHQHKDHQRLQVKFMSGVLAGCVTGSGRCGANCPVDLIVLDHDGWMDRVRYVCGYECFLFNQVCFSWFLRAVKRKGMFASLR